MSVNLSRSELLEITGGTSVADPPKGVRIVAAGVEFDSRLVTGGELFIALRGAQSDGHLFVKSAFDRGASLFLVEEPIEGVPSERLVVVKDSLAAFGQVAQWWRALLKIPVVAVTGSVGKTTVKEMAASILLDHSPGLYSLKSFNNHTGVPHTLCRMAREHRWAVLELGMNHPGEIRHLSSLVKPQCAVITRVVEAHVGHLGSVQAIARAKLEILEGLSEDGTIMLNADDPLLLSEYRALDDRRPVRYFGTTETADMRVSNVRSRLLEGITFTLSFEGERMEIEMPVVGRHNALNAACAALAAKTLVPSLAPESIVRGLSRCVAPLMRLDVKRLPDGRIIVDDSYNANPASMRALLDVAGDLKAGGAEVGLVLGDMRELGEFSASLHRELAEAVVALGPRFVISVGYESRVIHEVACHGGIDAVHAPSAERAAEEANERLESWSILFVKASRGVGLDRTVAQLLMHAQRDEQSTTIEDQTNS